MLLTLRWAEARGALPLESVFEVIRFGGDGAALERIPRARVSIVGVLVHRGYAIPVFDPRRWKGFFQDVPTAEDRYVVLVQTEDSLDGLVVEEVDVLREFERLTGFAEAQTKRETGLGKMFMDGAVSAERATWALLSIPRLGRAMHGES